MPPIDRDEAARVTDDLKSRLARALRLDEEVDRRTMLKGVGGAAAVGAAGASGLASASGGGGHEAEAAAAGDDGFAEHGHFAEVGEYSSGGFDPHAFLRTFNTGESGQDNLEQEVYEEGGRTVRHFHVHATDTEIEVVPGVDFPAWTYQGQVPGPTIRAVEGDLIRITFDNTSLHAHTIHPHLRNPRPDMDGIGPTGPGVIDSGDDEFTYEWPADPPGVHLYHCHSLPLKEHIHRGLYGTFIVDPDPERVRQNPRDYVNYHGPMTSDLEDELVERAKARNHTYPESNPVQELVLVMNGFDTNFDGDNEIYAANTRAFAYAVHSDGQGNWSDSETIHPIRVDKDRPVRVYLVNATEFDPINSFHTHSQFFDYYDHGTTLLPTKKRVDTVHQVQAERGIIELDYSDHEPGLFMFHAHQSEFAELGWMSFFEVS